MALETDELQGRLMHDEVITKCARHHLAWAEFLFVFLKTIKLTQQQTFGRFEGWLARVAILVLASHLTGHLPIHLVYDVELRSGYDTTVCAHFSSLCLDLTGR